MDPVPPVATDLIARFPTFAAVQTATISTALAEAATRVDATWTPGDTSLGVLLYAAHVLTLDGQGTSAEAALGAAGALGFSSLKSGSLSLDRNMATGGAGGSLLAATTYGRRFLALLRVNQPAILVP